MAWRGSSASGGRTAMSWRLAGSRTTWLGSTGVCCEPGLQPPLPTSHTAFTWLPVAGSKTVWPDSQATVPTQPFATTGIKLVWKLVPKVGGTPLVVVVVLLGLM